MRTSTVLRLSTIASLLLLAGPAMGESIATGCLAKATGAIYNLKMYSNGTRAACKTGDEIVRLAVQQPDTKFHKNRVTVPFETVQVTTTFPDELEPLEVEIGFVSQTYGLPEPTQNCELYLFYDEFIYLLASAPPNTDVDGMSSVLVFHRDTLRSQGTVKATTGAVRGIGLNWAVRVHDLFVSNRGSECFVAYLMEFANDPGKLYSR